MPVRELHDVRGRTTGMGWMAIAKHSGLGGVQARVFPFIRALTCAGCGVGEDSTPAPRGVVRDVAYGKTAAVSPTFARPVLLWAVVLEVRLMLRCCVPTCTLLASVVGT